MNLVLQARFFYSITYTFALQGQKSQTMRHLHSSDMNTRTSISRKVKQKYKYTRFGTRPCHTWPM